MRLRNIYFAYMVVVGVACGTVLVVAPPAAEYFIAPYFWVLIAVAMFDAGIFLLRRGPPATMLAMNARVFGFLIGAGLMLATAACGGSSVKLI